MGGARGQQAQVRRVPRQRRNSAQRNEFVQSGPGGSAPGGGRHGQRLVELAPGSDGGRAKRSLGKTKKPIGRKFHPDRFKARSPLTSWRSPWEAADGTAPGHDIGRAGAFLFFIITGLPSNIEQELHGRSK